jgi:thiol-disulfide isomerase/thioredoxin
MRSTVISAVADVLMGLGPLVLLVLGDNYLHVFADLRVAVVVLAALYLCVGIVRGRGRPRNAVLKGLLVGSGGCALLFILGWGQLHHAALAILLLISILFTICGVGARRLWAAQSAGRAALVLVGPLAGLSIAAVTILPALTTQIATRKTNAPAPVFSINRLDGAVVSPSEFRGRVVLLDFWATWCLPCRRELPELEKLYRQYQGNSSVSFWAVDVERNGDTPEKAREFMLKSGFTLPVAFADEKSLEALAPLNLEGFPSLIIMDKSGRIRLVHSGYDASEHLRAELGGEIDALLNESL